MKNKVKDLFLIMFSILHTILDMETHYLTIKCFVIRISNPLSDKILIET